MFLLRFHLEKYFLKLTSMFKFILQIKITTTKNRLKYFTGDKLQTLLNLFQFIPITSRSTTRYNEIFRDFHQARIWMISQVLRFFIYP